MSQMKSLAEVICGGHAGLDTELEHLAKSCIPCQEIKLTPPAAQLHSGCGNHYPGNVFMLILQAHSWDSSF